MKEVSQILDWYIEKLDNWVENDYNNMKGVFSFLSEALLVRKLAVSPNAKSGLEGLQSFLATEILEIHRNKASKISYQIIQRYLAGEDLKKKYRFNFDLLPLTLDKEANKKAFFKESKILKEIREQKGEDYLKKEIEECDEWLPFILLDEARKVLWMKANKYYSVCTESFCEGCIKKKQVYYQFTQAAVLFEILYFEFIQGAFRKHVQKGNNLLGILSNEVTEFNSEMERNHIGIGDVSEVKLLQERITDYGQSAVSKLLEITKEINYLTVFNILEAEFARDICAMYHLLMVFEVVNVHEEGRADMMHAIKMESEFKLKYGKFFEAFERTNEDKSVCYRRVNEHLEMVLSQYADKNYNIVKIVIGFLEELRKKMEKKEAPHYEEFLCLLALPVYKSLDGGKKIHINMESDGNRK